MAKILPVTEFGNPVLRKKGKAVLKRFLKTAAFRTLVEDMFKTMRATNGIGLAAPQIGKNLRLAVIELNPTPARPKLEASGRIIIMNPKIVSRSKKTAEDWEGCLSFGGKRCARGKVPRSQDIVVAYMNERGERTIRKASGLLARVFQHEIDHLNGIVFVDRMSDMKTLMTYDEFLRRIVRK